MATGVGLRIADDECIAAVVTEDGTVEVIERACVLHMSDDGDAALGGPAPTGHAHSIDGFVRAIGDPAGVDVDGGEAYRAEDLFATAMFCLIDLTTEHLSGPAEFYATHPAGWSTEVVRGVREALDYLGLKSVALLGEDELPQPTDGADPGKTFANAAAQAALVAVLATPAGATPPDPIVTENAGVSTDVMPAVASPMVTAQAYSAAPPVSPLPTKGMSPIAQAPITAAPIAKADKPIRSKTPFLIAAAALIGLLLGGVAVSTLLRDAETTPPPAISDARPETPTPTPEPALPPPPPVVTTTPAPVTTEPEPEATTTTEAPPTTTPEPTTPPTTTAPRTTTRPLLPFGTELQAPVPIPGYR
ncbi:hypothetical protein ACFWUP_09645 [Nocardia sp. NPDC058658]|uniref:hypothetical protein n=1 Tax=Nocardia sp. NPDC058658 TaxID=3346580 RepID=UPI00364CBFFC